MATRCLTMEMTRAGDDQRGRTPRATMPPWVSSITRESYPDASFRDVTAPNADTLYSTAWLDLSQGALRPQPAGRCTTAII